MKQVSESREKYLQSPSSSKIIAALTILILINTSSSTLTVKSTHTQKSQAEDAVFMLNTYKFASTSISGGYGSYLISSGNGQITYSSDILDGAGKVRTSVTSIEGTSIFVHCSSNKLSFINYLASSTQKNFNIGSGKNAIGIRDMGSSHSPSILCVIDDFERISLWDSTLSNSNTVTLQILLPGFSLSYLDTLDDNTKIGVSSTSNFHVFDIVGGVSTPSKTINLPGNIIGLSNCKGLNFIAAIEANKLHLLAWLVAPPNDIVWTYTQPGDELKSLSYIPGTSDVFYLGTSGLGLSDMLVYQRSSNMVVDSLSFTFASVNYLAVSSNGIYLVAGGSDGSEKVIKMTCHVDCLTCYGSTPDSCISCTVPELLEEGSCVPNCSPNYFKDGTNCLLSCPAGKLGNTSTWICDECTSPCSTCTTTLTTCTDCIPGKALVANTCVDCGAQQFLSGQTCVNCHGACNGCSAPGISSCTACASWFGNTGGDCLACGSQQFTAFNICNPCNTACNGCSAAGTAACTNCAAGYGLVGGNCEVCGTQQYLSGQSCLECDTACDECSTAGSSSCTACAVGYGNFGGSCVICGAQQYLLGQACLACDTKCDGCTAVGPSSCSACAAGFENVTNICTPIPTPTPTPSSTPNVPSSPNITASNDEQTNLEVNFFQKSSCNSSSSIDQSTSESSTNSSNPKINTSCFDTFFRYNNKNLTLNDLLISSPLVFTAVSTEGQEITTNLNISSHELSIPSYSQNEIIKLHLNPTLSNNESIKLLIQTLIFNSTNPELLLLNPFTLISPYQTDQLPEAFKDKKSTIQTFTARMNDVAQSLALASSIYPVDSSFVFLKVTQMIQIIEKLSLINIDYGPSVQSLMDSFGRKKISPDDPAYSEQRDNVHKNSIKSSGKLTEYYVPLSINWMSTLKLIIYISSFMMKFPIKIMINKMIRSKKASVWKCRLANILRRLHLVLWNSILLDIVFQGSITIMHSNLGQLGTFDFFKYILILVAQFLALYDVNTFFWGLSILDTTSWKGIQGEIQKTQVKAKKLNIDHSKTLSQIVINKPVRKFISSDLDESTQEYPRVFKYLTLCYLIRYVLFLGSIATLQNLPGLNLLVLLLIEIVYWITMLNAFYRFKEIKNKLVVLFKLVQSALFVLFFLVYFIRYLISGLRVNLSQGIETPLIMIVLFIILIEVLILVIGIIYAIIFITQKIFFGQKYPDAINIIVYYDIPGGLKQNLSKFRKKKLNLFKGSYKKIHSKKGSSTRFKLKSKNKSSYCLNIQSKDLKSSFAKNKFKSKSRKELKTKFKIREDQKEQLQSVQENSSFIVKNRRNKLGKFNDVPNMNTLPLDQLYNSQKEVKPIKKNNENLLDLSIEKGEGFSELEEVDNLQFDNSNMTPRRNKNRSRQTKDKKQAGSRRILDKKTKKKRLISDSKEHKNDESLLNDSKEKLSVNNFDFMDDDDEDFNSPKQDKKDKVKLNGNNPPKISYKSPSSQYDIRKPNNETIFSPIFSTRNINEQNNNKADNKNIDNDLQLKKGKKMNLSKEQIKILEKSFSSRQYAQISQENINIKQFI